MIRRRGLSPRRLVEIYNYCRPLRTWEARGWNPELLPIMHCDPRERRSFLLSSNPREAATLDS